MEIRDATQEDIEALADIYRYYVRTSIVTLEENEPSTDCIRHEWTEEVFSNGSPFIVAVEPQTGKLCGYAYVGPFNGRSGYRYTYEDSIYLHPEYCRRGLGKQLFRELLTRAKATSKTQIIAKMSIGTDQALEDSPSCRLHTSFGFRLVGRLSKVGYKFGEWVDVVIWQLDVESI